MNWFLSRSFHFVIVNCLIIGFFQDHLSIDFFQDHWVLSGPFCFNTILASFKTIYQHTSFNTIGFFTDHWVLSRLFINWILSRPLGSFKTLLTNGFFPDYWVLSRLFINRILSKPLDSFKTIYQLTSSLILLWILWNQVGFMIIIIIIIRQFTITKWSGMVLKGVNSYLAV